MARGTQQGAGDRQAPTMADVARVAGVSAMTVSRALREDGRVAQETRARIMAAVGDLGYVIDQSAGGLATRRTDFVAALIPSMNNSNFADTVRGITETLESTGMQLLLGYTDYTPQKEEKLIESLLRRRPEGMILTGGTHTDRARHLLCHAGIPIVETWDLPVRPIDHVVGFSNAAAMEMLVRRLAAKGYRRFGYIGGTSARDTRGNQRRDGFIRAVSQLGLPQGRVISFGVPPISMQQGAEAVVRLLEEGPDTEVVLCVSDLSAFGALTECQRRGMRVPEDIAIAGFGDYEVASCSHPRLTSVNVDCHGIGLRATDLLLRAIRGEAAPRSVIETTCRVVERESA